MTPIVAQIWRHPIKGVGAEPLDAVTLRAGRPLPLDRAWAVLEHGGETGEGWRACRNFIRGAKGPSLMAVSARVETVLAPMASAPGAGFSVRQEAFRLHLSHPDRPDLTIDPHDPADAARLVQWLIPIYPADRPAPVQLVESPPEGMSDAPFPSVAILGLSSLRALSDKVGLPLDPRRFRGNLWVEGTAPWEEFDWVGRRLGIGGAEFEVVERIGRCRATEANPDTGRRDAGTLAALTDGWGHTDFGVFAQVVSGGTVATGDQVRAA